MSEDEFVALLAVERPVLFGWIEAGWLVPSGQPPQYAEIDLARARLIRDLTASMGVNREGVDIILDLLDQMHGLRAAMSSLGQGLEQQPETVRWSVMRTVRHHHHPMRDL